MGHLRRGLESGLAWPRSMLCTRSMSSAATITPSDCMRMIRRVTTERERTVPRRRRRRPRLGVHRVIVEMHVRPPTCSRGAVRVGGPSRAPRLSERRHASPIEWPQLREHQQFLPSMRFWRTSASRQGWHVQWETVPPEEKSGSSPVVLANSGRKGSCIASNSAAQQ